MTSGFLLCKVMARFVDGVEKGRQGSAGQVLVRWRNSEFRAQSGQAKAILRGGASAVGSVAQGFTATGKEREGGVVTSGGCDTEEGGWEYEGIRSFIRAELFKGDLDRSLAQRDTERALLDSAKLEHDDRFGARVAELAAADARYSR